MVFRFVRGGGGVWVVLFDRATDVTDEGAAGRTAKGAEIGGGRLNSTIRTRSLRRSNFFRPFGADLFGTCDPRLAPWAAFFRRSAALQA